MDRVTDTSLFPFHIKDWLTPPCALRVISGDEFTAPFSDHDHFKVTGGLKVQLVCESTEHLHFLLTWLVVAKK